MKKFYKLTKVKKSIVDTIKYLRLLKESKLVRKRAKEKLARFFRGAPAGVITFIVAMGLFFASLLIVPLYILATKYNLTNLKIFIVSVLLISFFFVKICFDIRILNIQKGKETRVSIKKEIVIDNLYFWTNIYLFIFELRNLLSAWGKTKKIDPSVNKEIKQIMTNTTKTSLLMLLIIIAVLIIEMFFWGSKKNKFKSQEIKKTRSRMKGRYKYVKPRKR